MTRPNFTEDFKIDAIKQITERGYSVADVSKRLVVLFRSPYLSFRGMASTTLSKPVIARTVLKLTIGTLAWFVLV